MKLLEQKYRVPEILGEQWFNSEPIILSANRGRVICVFFWDATDQNSLHTLYYVKEWYDKYKEFDMIFIGIHSPKFAFGRNFDFVQNSIIKHKIKFPVVTDNEQYLRGIFKIRILPSVLLIDRSGYIRYFHEGEGFYHSLELALQILLVDAGYRGDLPDLTEPLREEDRTGIQLQRSTPEILVGYQLGSIGNTEGYFPQSVFNYSDPQLYLEGRVYLCGLWLVNKHFVKVGDSDYNKNYLIVNYRGKEVNAVIGPDSETNFRVFVMQDGKYLTREIAGADVIVDEDGVSYIKVQTHSLYNLVRNKEFGEHLIKLFPESDSFTFYSISFTSAPINELISGA